MSFRKYFRFVGIAIAIAAFTVLSQAQTAGDGKIANMTVGGSSVRWDVLVPNSGGSVLVSFPDGRSFKKAFRAGGAPAIDLSDKQLEGLPEGTYTYELLLAPVLTGAQKEALMKARGNDDDPEAERAGRKRPVVPSLVQHGSFAVINGFLVGPGAIEGERTGSTTSPQQIKQPATPARVSANTITRLRNHRFSLGAMFDFVIADDLIVQGSTCTGLDCVNGEVFNFDTLRLKENNTRISFHDTSTSAGFPTNDWIIRANSSASGGGNFLAFVDGGANEDGTEVGTIVFEVDAGAPANSLRVSSAGKIGIRTGSPVLDVHVTSTDTPAIRQEQTNGGGFTAQTWDIGANEANWFVRDVTGGSRLPFRIRPGAPTSSIDISATGNVGIGTASPASKLHVNTAASGIFVGASSPSAFMLAAAATNGVATDIFQAAISGATNGFTIRSDAANNLTYSWLTGSGAQGLFQKSDGSIGIGTTSPDQKLSVNGDADKTGGNTWLAFSDERLKNIKGNFNSGLKAVMQLQPIRYEYLKNNALGLKSEGEHIGFGAQAVQKIIPEAVTKNSEGYLMVNGDPIMWTMLNAIKEQQKEIEQLKGQIRKLQTSRRRHR